jgi:hypothetical protein
VYLIFVLRIRKQHESIKVCEEVQGGRGERWDYKDKIMGRTTEGSK